MKQCTETITVFNAALDEENGYDVYYPTVIKGVSWHCEIASTVSQTGLQAANLFTIRIPEDANFSGKKYARPAEYSDPEKQFTLQQGDIIVHAAVEDMLTPAQLQQAYGEIVTILGVTDSSRRPNARHWKVVGK